MFAKKLYDKMKLEGYKGITLKKVREVVGNQLTSQVFKVVAIRKDKFQHIILPSVGHQYGWDLLDMSKYSQWNKGYKWLMNTIDIHSRYLYSVPLKE